jgi:beta-glucosidase
VRFLKTALGVAAVLVLAVVLIGALVLGWRDPKRPVQSAFTRRAAFVFADVPRGRALPPEEVDGYARRLLSERSRQQKVLQMSGDTTVVDLLPFLIGEPLGPWRAGADRRLRLPPLAMSDGPRGMNVRKGTVCYPVAMMRAASWDRGLERRVAEAVAEELRASGANVWLAPCVNLLRHPFWGRAQETYGEDPYLVGEMGAAAIEGAQGRNVMAVAKHFALNSIEETRLTVDVRTDERTLREVYLPHFKRAVDADVAAVMSAYNHVNGDQASESRHLLTEVLKEEWGFRGFVMSDWFDGVHDGVKAARAGLDLEMPSVLVYGQTLQAAVQRGDVAEAAVDAAVLRILRRRIEYAARSSDAPARLSSGHEALSQEAAERGMVLLKNDGLLPFSKDALRSLAVIGRLADVDVLGDHGSSRMRPRHAVTFLAGLRDALGAGRVTYADGADVPAARAAARAADVAVVVAGFDFHDEGEYIPDPHVPVDDRGGDRKFLGLKPQDVALVQAVAAENPRTVVVLTGGAAITVEEWHEKTGAILMAFYPGQEGGHALARVLLGDVNPSGRLPVTVPKDASQLPPWDNRSQRVEYGPYHGYTLVEKKGWEPRYPFGFGLSYTTFRFAKLSLDARAIAPDGVVHASVDVTNTGTRAGRETVQLYAGFTSDVMDRPVKLLRGFETVDLAPGETTRVTLPLRASDLARYDPDAKRWLVDPGTYRVLVGPSSRSKDLLEAPLQVGVGPPCNIPSLSCTHE